MSHTQSLGTTAGDVPLRVRDQAREVLALVTFSAVTATVLTLGLMLILHLGQRG